MSSDRKAPGAPGGARPLWDPYVAGVALGLVLLASFVIMGQGLGASGGVVRATSALIGTFARGWVANNRNLASLFEAGANPLWHYLVFLGFGVFLGGYLGAMTGRRFQWQMERGFRAGRRLRGALAFGGGILMGIAARIGYGCTSGQALTGGAALAAGSWAFMMCVFAGGYAVAWFVRRQWT